MRSGLRVGTLLARCSCFLLTRDTRAEVMGCRTFSTGRVAEVPVLLLPLLVVMTGVEARDAENFLRFLRRAASAGPILYPKTW